MMNDTETASIPLQVAGRSDIGLKRKVNQDSFRTQVPTANMESRYALFVLADGVGGNLPKGEIASRTAVDAMIAHYYALGDGTDGLSRAQRAVQAAHEAVREQAAIEGEIAIGSTLAGVALSPEGEAIVFNVGDSRIYRLRGKELTLISQDQVAASPMSLLHDESGKKKKGGRDTRVTKITSYMGQPSPLQPFFYRLDAEAGDTLLICSDGIWGVLEDDEMRDLIVNRRVENAADLLVSRVKARGAPDNLSVILIHLGEISSQRGSTWALLLLVVVLLAAVIGAVVLSSGIIR